MYSPNNLHLTDIPDAYDVINVAFAVPSVAFGAEMVFEPDAGLYPNNQDFIDDIAYLHSLGKHVLISIGGANGPVSITTQAQINTFVTSMNQIIAEYDFDGIDIDLESGSFMLQTGDNNFMNPTTPAIVNFITAINLLLALHPASFILTAAPETALAQGGYSWYGGVWGAYLPLIYAFRDRWTYIHVQHYNSGSMTGRDGNTYQPATADFHSAMADMMIAGFPAGGQYFPGLRADQVAIGLPASPAAASTGYTSPAIVNTALDYIIQGISYGGQYHLANPNGYDDFRGVMTWSINWDVQNNCIFSNNISGYFSQFVNSIDNLTIGISGNNVALNWEDIPSAYKYYIYRFNTPYFNMSGASPIDSTTISQYIDPGASANTTYFYNVTFIR